MSMLIRRYMPILVLGCAVLLGALGRGTALYRWDGDHTLHPDERFLVYTVVRLQVPDQWQAYGDNDCVVDGKVPAPSATRDLRGVERAPKEWEPSGASGCNSLNPRNFGWSARFVYGSLPTTIVRVLSDALFGRDATPIEIRNTGRTIAWLSEVVAIVLVYWVARAMLPPRASAWAAMLYALAPLPMQLSHFFTVDAMLSPWVVGALGIAVRLHHQRWRDWVLFAACVAIASAMRITMLSVAGLAVVVWVRQVRLAWSWRMSGMAMSAALVGTIVLWVADPTWWQNGWFEARWLADIAAAGRIVAGGVDTPPSFQWVDAVPWLYPWWQLSWWGLGPLVATGAVYGIWLTMQRRWRPAWVLLIWLVGFFVWQGGVFGMTMRYYLPMYAGLSVFAMVALIGIPSHWRQRVLVVIIGASFVPALAWQQMYDAPHPRIAASEWMYAHIPDDAVIAVEHWDDALPLGLGDDTPGRYQFVELPVFDADRPGKFVTIDSGSRGMIARIAQADYIVVSSARGHGVIPKMPLRYPVTTRYYSMLFDGQLGYELVYQATRWPHLGPWWWDTRAAEEALSVYDHPQVLIFANRARLDVPALTARLLADVRWSEVADTTTVQYRAHPDLGLLDVMTWQEAHRPDWPWRGSGGWSTWLLLVDGLMLVLVPWLGRWRDHGITIGRAMGMLLLIGVSALPTTIATLVMALGVLIPLGVWGWWRRWRQIVTQVRHQWRLAVGGEVIWLVMVGLAAWWAGGASQPNDWWRQVAIINQQMSGTWSVVAEPWLAGFAALDGAHVLRAAALLGLMSGSDGQLALTMMLATATGVMAQVVWYASSAQELTRRQLVWRGVLIVAVLAVGNLVPLVRAILGVADPLWSASQTPDSSGWLPTTWLIAVLRADSTWLWRGIWWVLAAVMLWRRAWWELAILVVMVMTLGTDMVWWIAVVGAGIVCWRWWGHWIGWVALVGLAMLVRAVAWQAPQGSATMLLLHLWPVVVALGWLVWQQQHRSRRAVLAVGLWLGWGVICAWGQLPVWLLLVGWALCAVLIERRNGVVVWLGIAVVGVVSMMPLPLMTIGYQLMTMAVWGFIGWVTLVHVRPTWWLAPALMWLVWSGSIARPTLFKEDTALATHIRSLSDTTLVIVDTDVNRAQRMAAASGSILWVAPPSQIDPRWLAFGWRDVIRQRWQQTLEADAALICAGDTRIDVVLVADEIVRCR